MENTNKEQSPHWMNHGLIIKILSKNYEGTSVSLTKLEVTPAVPKGENFMSTIYRAYVEYEKERCGLISNKYLIIKTQLPGEAFEKELHVFEEILPMMSGISSEFGRVYEFSAKYFGTDTCKTIFLEDLQHLGYKMEDRLKGLDLDHCIMAVRCIARFHGFSRKLEEINPEIFDIFREGFYVKVEEKKTAMSPSSRAKIIELASEVGTWPKFQQYAKSIKKLYATAGSLMFDLEAPNVGSFNVLNHGDFWTNNILFRYCPGTDKILDLKFVDFQLSTISSPALDLQYFITTSCADDVRYEHREALLQEYHSELIQTLNDLNLDPDQYTLQELKMDFEEKELYGLLVGCFDLSDLLADRTDVESSSEQNIFKGKRFVEVFKAMLLYYSKKGII